MIKFYKNNLILFLIVVFLPSCTAFKAMKLVNSGEAVSNTNLESVVPFALKGHPILIKAKLNNSPKEYTFILDTGALNMIRQEVAKELGLPKGIEVEAGDSGGKSKTIELIKLDRVIVGNMQVLDIATGVTDLSELISPNIAGILGSNFFKHFKITIDYQENKITLSQDTKPIKLKDNEIRIPFKTDMKNGFAPKIECVVDGKIKGTGIVDTGAVGIADLPLAMMKKTSSFKEGAVLTANGSMSAGMFGVVDESLAIRVKEIKIGDLKLINIPSMSHASKMGHVHLGNKFLEKFLVTLNYPAEEMILKPYGLPFETNIPSYGLALTKKDKKTLISGVVKNSTAAKKGLQPGNEIVKINSREVSSLSLMELMSMFINEDINSIEIEFIKEKRREKTTLHKEMLFPVL
jgi:predicted aspartyl protease